MAKELESKSTEQAYHLFYESTERYSKIEKLIHEKRDFIIKAKFKYKRTTFINHATGFIIGVFSGIIANNIDMIQHLKSFLDKWLR